MEYQSLFDQLGGRSIIEQVHSKFYDKIYSHPWLGKYFHHRTRPAIESQQTDFMTQLMGGPKIYAGQNPKVVHQYMMITEELFDLRSELLSQAIKECGVSDDLREQWLEVNDRFKQLLVKKSFSECSFQYATQEMLHFPKPDGSVDKSLVN